MRPHRIRLSAFGPYPGVVDVDLDALGAGGLFLLHGPTGAGKTTLLDGLCFALYGRVPRAMKAFRSDHASADATCFVELELTVGGRRLRITRTPAYDRPKLRGEGTIKEQPTARLEQLRGGSWTTVSTRLDEVGHELDGLLGMTAEQFWQVVLLPQGQFADFLRADAPAREKLLQALFRGDRFRDAEAWLADHRRAIAQRFDAASREARTLTALVADTAGVDEPEEPTIAWYDEVLEAVSSANVAAAGDVLASDAAVTRLAAELRAAEELASRQRRLAAARATLTALDTGADTVADARTAVDLARLAAPLMPLADRAAASSAAAEAARLRADRASAGLPEVDGDLRSAAEAARTRIGTLDALTAQAARLTENERRIVDLGDRAAAVTTGLADIAAERSDLPGLRAAAAAALSAARAAALARPDARARVERATALAADAARRDRLRLELAAATADDTAAREAALLAGEAHLSVRTALLAGQAARLASELEDGKPCAVCGSEVHPAPADAGDLVDEAALTAAEAVLDEARDRRAQTQKRLALITAEIDQLDDALAGWSDDLAGAAADLVVVEATAAGEPDTDEAVRGYDELDRALERRATALAQERRGIADAIEDATASAATDRAVVDLALDGAADLSSALAATVALAAALDAAADARADADRALAQRLADDADLAEGLARNGFDDVAALRSATATDLAALEGQLKAYDEQLAAARGTLADPDLDVPLDPPADPASVGADHHAAVRARQTRGDLAAVAAETHKRVAAHGPALRRAIAGLEPLRAERDLVHGVADLAGGKNALGMTLSTYVLAARLEEVAAAATRRLTLMSDGRYALRHSDVRTDGRRKSGLGLVVHDSWTGKDRDTGTLSGGETFVASLALALGLADTVTAEAGGAPIEALFVDEGFGTLDEDTLDEVMDVLDGLRAGGRVVGLVSHVAELRQRIPSQLRVHKGQDGSTLEVVA